MTDDALGRARAILADAGIDARVERAGHQRDILVVGAGADRLEAVRAVTDALRAAGFRYIAIDIATQDA